MPSAYRSNSRNGYGGGIRTLAISSETDRPIPVFVRSVVLKSPDEVKRIAVNRVMGLELEYVKTWINLP